LSESSEISYQLLVPKILRKEIVKNCHDTFYAAHFGISKTLGGIKKDFHSYKISEDVKFHVRCYAVCGRFRSLSGRPGAALRGCLIGYPVDRIGVGVVGPLPKSKNNNRYILVIGDHFTRWMEAYPLPNQQAETIAVKLVHEFIARYGTPLEIHSDQGKNFESSLFSEICKLFEVRKTRTTSYRPCSNGIIEKFNGALEKLIGNFVNKNASNWDSYIGILMSAYRSTPHSSTGYTPNMLMFGREVYTPNQLMFPLPRVDEVDQDSYVSEVRDKLAEIFHLARNKLYDSAVCQKRNYDTRLSQNEFPVGYLVYKYNDFCKNLKKNGLVPLS
jgi:hypothetical protein